MEWTETHDILLCRELLLEEPYKFKKGSNERGKKWTGIAESLNKNSEVKFKVTQRSVRERMERLEKKYMEKRKEEELGSGLAVDEMSELETLIEEIIDREKLAEESRDSEGTQKKVEADKQTAEEMRQEVMERFGETQKRAAADGDQGRETKRGRRSGNDAMDFLKEKTEKENELRAEEIALKKQEQQQESARQAQVLKQQNSMFEAMQNMQMVMMQQQQQQTAAMMALVEKLLPKGP